MFRRKSRKSRKSKKRTVMGVKCNKKQIMRVGYYRGAYTRNDGTKVKGHYVSPSCIKDQGRKGRGAQILPKVEPGLLTKYGYSLSKKADIRRKALDKAIKKEGKLKILRRTVYIRTLNKSKPLVYNKLNADVKHLQAKYF